MLGSIGPLEIGIVLVVALLVFGPKRLPELGSSLGQSMRGFGKGLKGEEDEAKPEVTEGRRGRGRPRGTSALAAARR